MPRKTRTAIVKRNTNPATVRHITAQIKHLSDSEVYALTFAGDRAVRRVAMNDAHRRAEEYALANER